MIEQLKSALLGEQPRTDGGSADEGGQGTTRDGSTVGEVDPFRPATDRPAEGDDKHVEMDEIFGVLGNQRRRYVLAYLKMTEGTVTMSDLAEQIAAWECNKEIEQIDSQERKRVYVALYQCHLPKMADTSAIEYDRPRGNIESGEQFESFSYYLRQDE
jgi:hypothetical protein